MLLLAWSLACAPADTAADPAVDPNAPTWAEDVGPLVQARCTGCHQSGGAAFDLSTPEQASAMAEAMAAAVASGVMPPWGARDTEDCVNPRAWVDDRRLSDDEVALLRAWADAGAPLGEGADRVTPTAGESLGAEALAFEAPTAYTTTGADDEFVCVVIDPALDEDLWVDAIDVEPTNDTIAHHALVFYDPTGAAAAAAGDDGWYPCTNNDGQSFLATWVPGSGPTWAPEGVGMEIPAGAQIVVQMHYHPGGLVGESDRPSVTVRPLATRPTHQLYNTLLGNQYSEAVGLEPGPDDRGFVEFRIPADVAGHTEEMVTTLDRGFSNLPIATVGAHMHLIGTQMEVWIERETPDEGEPERECLLPVANYDYDWQQLYRYEGSLSDAPQVSGGDSVRLRCTYDNTLDNPGTRRALDSAGLDAPVDVYLGEGTLDEMCILMVGVVI